MTETGCQGKVGKQTQETGGPSFGDREGKALSVDTGGNQPTLPHGVGGEDGDGVVQVLARESLLFLYVCVFSVRLLSRQENGEASGYAVTVVVKRGGVGFAILREKC